jgi:hypothetical protein
LLTRDSISPDRYQQLDHIAKLSCCPCAWLFRFNSFALIRWHTWRRTPPHAVPASSCGLMPSASRIFKTDVSETLAPPPPKQSKKWISDDWRIDHFFTNGFYLLLRVIIMIASKPVFYLFVVHNLYEILQNSYRPLTALV